MKKLEAIEDLHHPSDANLVVDLCFVGDHGLNQVHDEEMEADPFPVFQDKTHGAGTMASGT